MLTNVPTLGPDGRHVYRLALYGRKNSGKSCILAALAMGIERVPHPDGLGCVWVCDESTVPVPAGDPYSWDQADPAVTRHLGREWLKLAVEKLKAGDVPPPTPINKAPFRFYFDFSEKKTGRAFRVELIDYSGELVRAEGSEDLFVRQLREHLETMDGILVLAEAPRCDEESRPLYKELSMLLEAFTLLSDKRRGRKVHPFPVAMVFNKWDRQSRMEAFSPIEASVEVDVFLRRNPPPPQLGLINILETVSGSTTERSNCHPFALSAFGKAIPITRTSDTGEQVVIDLPASSIPLPAYGMEDPFVWLCKRADEIEADRLTANLASLKPWNLKQAVKAEALTIAKQISTLAKRFPASAPERRTINGLVQLARMAFVKQVAFAAGLLLLLFLLTTNGAMFLYDYTTYYPHERAIAKVSEPDSLDQWKSAESYLSSYVQPNWYRTMSHVILRSRSTTQENLDSLRERITVASRVDAELAALERGVPSATSDASVTQIRNDALLVEVPSEYDFLIKRRAELEGKLADKKRELVTNIEEAKCREEFEKMLDNLQLAEAANYMLGEEVARLPNLRVKLAEVYRAQAPLKLKAQVQSLAQKSDWNGAEAAISSFRTSNAIKDAMQNDVLMGKVSTLAEWVRIHRRESLYDLWYNRKDERIAQEILAGDDEQYKSYIQGYQAYRKSLTTSENWKIKIRELELDNLGQLNNTWGNPKLSLEIRDADGTYLGSIDREFTVSSSGRTAWIGTDMITTSSIRPSDELSISVSIKASWSINGEWNVGEIQDRRTIVDMSRPLQLRDSTSNPYWSYYFPGSLPPRVVLAVDSPALPSAPTMPSPQNSPSIDTVPFP